MAPEVHSITDAQRGTAEQQAGRTKKYLISMSIRTVCFILAIVIPGWPRVAFIVAAVVLPYLAVVIANAGRENDDPPISTRAIVDSRALTSTTHTLEQ
mgnify:CR=1 FL=1